MLILFSFFTFFFFFFLVDDKGLFKGCLANETRVIDCFFAAVISVKWSLVAGSPDLCQRSVATFALLQQSNKIVSYPSEDLYTDSYTDTTVQQQVPQLSVREPVY